MLHLDEPVMRPHVGEQGLLARPYIICRKTARDSSQLPQPPIICALALLEDLDSVTFGECQVSITLTRKVVQRSDEQTR